MMRNKIIFTNLSWEKSEKNLTLILELSGSLKIVPIGIPDLNNPPAPDVNTIASFSINSCCLVYCMVPLSPPVPDKID